MALKRIRLLWGTPPLTNGSWRLGLWNRRFGVRADGASAADAVPAYWKGFVHYDLYLSLRGLLVWAASALVLAHGIGSGLLVARWKKANPHNQVGYFDVVFPWRWDDLDRLRASGWALQGRAALERGEFWQGLTLARLALARDPSDWENREQVARMLVAMRLVPQARQILHEGLERNYPGRKALLFAAELAQNADIPGAWEEVMMMAKARLSEAPPENNTKGEIRWLAEQEAQTWLELRQYEKALEVLRKTHRPEDRLWVRTEVLRLLDADRPGDAFAIVKEWAAEEPGNLEPWRLLARAARAASDAPALVETLQTLRNRWPTRVEVWLFGLVQLRLAGMEAESVEWYEEVLRRLGARAELPGPLALVLSEMGMESELESFEEHLREHGRSLIPIWSARMRGAVAMRDWSGARRWAEQLLEDRNPGEMPDADVNYTYLVKQLAVACLETSSASQSSLIEACGRRPLGLKMYYLIIDALAQSERFDTAARVLSQAEGPYLDAAGLVMRRRQVESGLARQGADTEERIKRVWSSFEAFKAELAANAEGDAGALTLIRRVRRDSPDWLSVRSAELEDLELPLQARTGDILTAQMLVRRKLVRHPTSTAEILDLARALWNAERPEEARMLAREVLRALPDQEDALRLLENWRPAPEKG